MIECCIETTLLPSLVFKSYNFPLCNTRGARPLTLGLCPEPDNAGSASWCHLEPETRALGDKSLFTRAQTWTKPRKLSRRARPRPEPGLSGQISAITDHSNCHTSNLRAQCYFECHAISFVVSWEYQESSDQWPSQWDQGEEWGWWPGDNHQRMPPHKEPQSLEQLSCQVLLAVLYHLTIRHDHDVTQSGQRWSG